MRVTREQPPTGEPRNPAFVPHVSVAQETGTCVSAWTSLVLLSFSIHHAAGAALVKRFLPLIGYRSWYCDRKRLAVLQDFYLYIHLLQILQSRSSAWLTIY